MRLGGVKSEAATFGLFELLLELGPEQIGHLDALGEFGVETKQFLIGLLVQNVFQRLVLLTRQSLSKLLVGLCRGYCTTLRHSLVTCCVAIRGSTRNTCLIRCCNRQTLTLL